MVYQLPNCKKKFNTLCASISTAPMFMIPSNAFAALLYSGANALQWPHHGA